MKKHKTPEYCRASKGRAYTRIDGQWFTLGRYNSQASRDKYDAIVAEWLANGRRLPQKEPDATGTVSVVLANYLRYAADYYVGSAKELNKIKTLSGVIRKLYAVLPAANFGPPELKTIRQVLIERGNSRGYINSQMGRVCRMFQLAVEDRVVAVAVYSVLKAVAPLVRGHTAAREGRTVTSVPDAWVDSIKPYVSRQVWALVELMRLTGMRCGEACAMRACDIDMTGSLWIYTPETHKTAHRGHHRVVELGKRSQEVIRGFLRTDLEAPLFSPAQAMAEHRTKLHARRKTPMSCGNRPGSNRKAKPRKQPRDRYDSTAVRQAVQRACKRAGVPQWHPHQLRHSFLTRVRKEFGLELASTLAGHRHVAVTERYAHADRQKARAIVAKIG